MSHLRSVFFLYAVALGACGSTEFRSFAAAGSDGIRFFGVDAEDIWAIEYTGKTHHSDGGDFVDVLPPTQLGGKFASICSAGRGKIFAASPAALLRVGADGGVEDFTAEVPLGDGRSRAVFGERGAVLAIVDSSEPRTYLFDGTHFRRIASLPPIGGISRLVARGPNDIWLMFGRSGDNLDGAAYTRDQAVGLLHFDGSTWTEGTATGVQKPDLRLTSARFPEDDLWLGCGGLRLHDGVLLPLGVQLPATGQCTSYYNARTGRPGIVFQPLPDPIAFPAYWACDTELCGTVDLRNYRDFDWHRMEWNGTEWVDDEYLGTFHDCVGYACMGEDASFVADELEDGTQIIAGAHVDKGKGLLLVSVGGGDAAAPATPVTYDPPDLQSADLVTPPDLYVAPDLSPTPCQDYCQQFHANCNSANGQAIWLYASVQECVSACAASGWPAGNVNTTFGNSFECRRTYAAAAFSNAAANCGNASAFGGSICGSVCDVYCGYAQRNCTGGNQLYADANACMTACTTYQGTSPTAAKTLCKELELLRAGFDTTNTATHCSNGSTTSSFCP